MSGSTGCNRCSGPYTVDGDTLVLGAIVSTQMACPPPARAGGDGIRRGLESVAGWRVEDDELVLLDAEDGELLRFGVATPVGSWLARASSTVTPSRARLSERSSPPRSRRETSSAAPRVQHVPCGVYGRCGRDRDLGAGYHEEALHRARGRHGAGGGVLGGAGERGELPHRRGHARADESRRDARRPPHAALTRLSRLRAGGGGAS